MFNVVRTLRGLNRALVQPATPGVVAFEPISR